MLRHPLTYFDIQRYFQNESNLKGIYWQNELPNISKVFHM